MYVFKIVTINVNGIRSPVTQTLLKKFLFDNDIDVVLLQEINDDNLDSMFPQYKYVVNLGESNRGTAIVYRAHLSVSNIDMSSCGRITALTTNNIRLINVYAPSGSQKKEDRNLLFCEDILFYLRKLLY